MIRMILTDIEGTISSISFVKEVLFPYARSRLRDFLIQHFEDPEVIDLRQETENIVGKVLDQNELVKIFEDWIDEDRKITPLKTLQGMIWEEGFRQGIFKAHFYEDAAVKLRSWNDSGLPIFIYSSGSVFAQKLFFSHTEQGNVLGLFSGHFDTTIGGKKDMESYKKISAETGFKPSDIVFFSDIEEELDAASAAGMITVLINRNGNSSSGRHREFSDFGNIWIDSLN